MNDAKLIKAFENHSRAIHSLNAEFKAMQKVLDKTYVQSLTHVMMWDVLMSLLAERSIVTQEQFDLALAELSKKTQKAMEEAERAKSGENMSPEGKVTVLSQEPQIPVIS